MTIFSKKWIIFPVAVIIALSSCAKIPDAPISPSVKVNYKISSGQKIFNVVFICGLKNENSNTAFTNVSGIAVIKKGSDTILEIPFKKDVIIPFEIGLVESEIEVPEGKVSPLIELLGIDKAELAQGNEQKSVMIDEQNISIKKLNLDKTDITGLLRSRLKK